jgi:antigen flippase
MSTSIMKNSGLSKAFQRTFLTTMGMTAAGFISSVITARVLGPEGRGVMSAALLVSTISAGIAQSGLASSYVYHHGAKKRFSYPSLLFYSISGIMVVSCLIACFGITVAPALKDMALLVIVISAFTGAQTYFFTLSQLQSNLYFFNKLRFGSVMGNIVLLGFLIIAVRVVTPIEILISQLFVLIFLSAAGGWWALKHEIWKVEEELDATTLRRVVGYGLSQHGTAMLSLFLLNFDKLVLLTRGNVIEYGYYALAFSTSRLIGSVQDAVSVALFSRFAGRDADRLAQAVGIAFRLTFLPLLIVAAVGALSAPWFLNHIYGKQFGEVAAPFAILLFECVVGGASWTLAQRFNASGRPELVLIRQFISVVPVIAGIPFLPEKNAFDCLAMLMLAGACLRLAATLALYKFELREPLPSMMPTKRDGQLIRNIFVYK